MPAITCCLPPSLKAFLPTVEKWEGLEQASGHQCWLPLHSGSIPPPASHYLPDREPLEPHLDELQPRGGGSPTRRRQQNPFRRLPLSSSPHPFSSYTPQTSRAGEIAQTQSLNLVVRQKRSLSKILLTHHVYSPLGCIYQTFKNIISIKICIFL